MFLIYRRHRRRCKHKDRGREWRHCECPIHVDGFLNGCRVRVALKTRDWNRAQVMVRDMEAEGRSTVPVRADPMSLSEAWDKYLADLRARKRHESTVSKYDLLRRQMLNFAEKGGLRFLKQVDLDTLTTFRAGWRDGPRTSVKKLERMRAFFRFAQKRKWIDDNSAQDLESPRVPVSQTKPYEQAEWMRILTAVDQYPGAHGRSGQSNARCLRAFVLFLRYTGMRIGDAVSCRRNQLVRDRLFIYTQKTGVPVCTVLPMWVLDALEAVPRASEEFFFWTGNGKLHSAVGSWQRSLKKLFELAKVRGGHAHRFRHTFAVDLLLAGVPLERVSVLLGHQSTRITERYYAPWVRSRQEQLEADVRRIWETDAHLHDTPLAHEKSEAVN